MKRRFTINMMIVATYLAISKITGNELGLSFLPVIVLWAEEHNYITKAALEVLSEKEQKFLEPERDLLWKVYCEFPDLNGPNYGRFGGESGDPEVPRTIDIRREWDISYYCGFDPVTQKAPEYIPGMLSSTDYCPPFHHKETYVEQQGYCPMGNYGAPARYFPKVIDCWRDGRL
ncbi:MAG: hypothetical protein WC074_09035, partial [bacterium]